MRLRRRILLSFAMFSLVNAGVSLLILEAAHLSRQDSITERNFAAPGLALVAVSLAAGGVLTAYLFYHTLRRNIEAAQRELAFTERLAATGRLAAGVAHEINNPLGGVMNALVRLKKGGLPPEREARYHALCEDGLNRIRGTVRRILDFSRKKTERGPVVVSGPLRQSVELVRHLLAPARVELRMDIPDQPGNPDFLKTVADAGDLQHVFLNLLVNAVDAMPDGGVLTVSAREEGRRAVVGIADTGVGLTEEELSASFDLFHTTKPVGKGTGLGLSIAHHIVEGCGGALTLTSKKGAGTTATVSLPKAGGRRTRIAARSAAGGTGA